MTLAGNQLFPSDNPWNQNIAAAPVAANSSAIINNVIFLSGKDGRLHPDFGQVTGGANPLYGIPYNVVHGNSTAKVDVVVDDYASESDIKPVPIPANAVIEGDQQGGPTVGLANRSDSHLIVYDQDNNIAYELFAASRPSENGDGKWHAAQESVWDLNKDSFRPQDWTSADAAGLAILPGLVRPDEGLPVGQGGQGVINHAIRFTLTNKAILNQFIYPASHTANPGNTNAAIQPAMGTRFRLKAGVDISRLSPESRVIAQAMKTYGLILADNGSNFFFSGASESIQPDGSILTWDDNDIQSTLTGLKSLTFSNFEVVDTTPVVTGLSVTTAAAGTTITVIGQNFSGAAGHLNVSFGTAAAMNVAVVDDSHVRATVPAGSGTVDVRVQSGVTTSPDSRNAKSPIFGYGTSAASAADRFTYSTAPAGPTASFVGTDSTTRGNWAPTDGYQVIGGSASLPAYATVTPSGHGTTTWTANTSDPRAPLVTPGSASTARTASCWYGDSFTVDVNLTDGQTHKVSLYLLDWDGSDTRAERVDVLDAATGTVLDSRAASSFSGGKYLTWSLTGHVQFRVTRTANDNAIVSAIEFGDPVTVAAPPSSATFVGTDATTRGNWTPTDGYQVIGGSASLPAYATVTPSGHGTTTWTANTSDPRAPLVTPGSASTERTASCWYGQSFTVDVNLTDGQAHKVSLYLLDWDSSDARAERVDVLDAATGAVLDSRTASSFSGGKYLTWSLTGHVQFRVTRTAGDNAVVSAIEFG